MKNILLFTILILATMHTYGQHKQYEVTKDSANGSQVFRGVLTIDDLMNEPTFGWMKDGVAAYQPNALYTEVLRQHLPEYAIMVFLGTWCDDSHYWVPKLVKLLQTINYPPAKLSLYGVDRTKTTPGGEQAQYHLTLVPAIILLKDGKEAGRITESPQNGLEADLKNIVQPGQ